MSPTSEGVDLAAAARDAMTASAEAKARFAQEAAEPVAEAARLVAECLDRGGKVLLCGNGGSAADAQHIAGELVGRFKLERPAFHAVALTTDTSVLTSIANDYGFDEVFARQAGGLGAEGDVLMAYSTSGSSKNILRAIQAAKTIGMTVARWPASATSSSPLPAPTRPSSRSATPPPATRSACWWRRCCAREGADPEGFLPGDACSRSPSPQPSAMRTIVKWWS